MGEVLQKLQEIIPGAKIMMPAYRTEASSQNSTAYLI